MRLLLIPIAVLLLILAAPEAEAEEMFVLDDGVVLRGFVVREEDGGQRLVIRLAGFASVNTITVEASRIVRRHVLRRPGTAPRELVPTDTVYKPREVATTRRARPVPSRERSSREETVGETVPALPPPVEPNPEGEVFFVRLARVAKLAIPVDPTSRVVVGLMVFLFLGILVNLGARLADLNHPTITKTVILGGLLMSILIADVFYPQLFLTSHRALIVIPSQVLGWIVASRLLLGGPIARNFLLAGFVLFSAMTFCFVTGAVLVTI